MTPASKFYVADCCEHCRTCYRWMPDMDLRLAPAKPMPRTPEWRRFGETCRQVEAAA